MPPAQLQGLDGVGKVRRFGIRLDGGDFGLMLGKGAGEGGPEVLGADAVEGWNTVWGGPILH